MIDFAAKLAGVWALAITVAFAFSRSEAIRVVPLGDGDAYIVLRQVGLAIAYGYGVSAGLSRTALGGWAEIIGTVGLFAALGAQQGWLGVITHTVTGGRVTL